MFVTGGEALGFATGAHAQIGLDMRAGRDFLQDDFDRLAAFVAFKGKEAGWAGHGCPWLGGQSAHFSTDRQAVLPAELYC